MSWLISTIITGITSFVATNIDDMVVMMLFFARLDQSFRPKHIIIGKYLGFSLLIAASLPGFFGAALVPKTWIGLLGFVPILIGITYLANSDDKEKPIPATTNQINSSRVNIPLVATITSLLDAKTYEVAAVTFANGGDNIGIYVPIFANSDLPTLVILLSVFFVALGVWCYLAYLLSQHPRLAPLLTRYGKRLVPFVLIGLGLSILIESGAYQLLPPFNS
ncbi:MAG TPA: cadmium resistance transporter [Oscillatoriaceae cyanobacterium M33_DOE_052]|uniref:Transporter n=1 Tax=Planktothricoides sp. SpSt-374 TaxID=2282167 RepID=A0A7C3VP63_9CYAN|nr:cadmium resistance transporter [Oscillatoriaceae cyanobacterium M33_DOE_052]